MAFWGAMVPDDEPYTLRLEGDHKRVCITQATLGDYIGRYWTTSCSKLKCAVGSKPPVYICALSKERPFTRLKLEFEESDEVVFSIRGPQGIHLTGHYAPQKAAGKKNKSTSTDDLPISTSDCSVEEKLAVAENEEPKKLTAEDDVGHTDSLVDGDEHNLGKGDKLVNAEVNDDANEKMAEEQHELICAFDTEPPQGGDEDYVLCIRKILATANKKSESVGKDASKATIEPDSMVENAGTVDNNIKENTYAIRETSLPSDVVIPPNDVNLDKGTEPEKISSDHFIKEDASDSNAYATAIEDDEVEQEDSNKNSFQTLLTKVGEAKEQALNCGRENMEKENKRMHGGEENIDKVDSDCHAHAAGEVEEQKAHSESDALHQDFARNQLEEMPSINVEIGGLHPSQPTAVIEDVVEKPEETLTNWGVHVLFTTTSNNNPANYQTNANEASEEENFDHNLVDSRNKVNVSHAKEVEKQMPSSDKVIGGAYPGEGNYRHSFTEDKVRQDVKGNENMLTILPKNAEDRKPIDELAREEHVQQKRQKTEASKIENNACVVPCKTRILSNGMIIEDVAIGKCDGQKAAPGRKVKIFYTARLRDTGALVDTNVGENPLKFRLGDKRIIPGLNIGIDGMRIEGRRRLFIPPAVGYGEKVKDHLPPNAWLVYDIELVGVSVKIRRRKCG